MILDIFIIACICTLIIESGFFDEIEIRLSKILFRNKHKLYFGKIFHCALCATTWVSIAYILLHGEFSLYNLCIVLLFAYSTNILAEVLHFVIDLGIKIIYLLRTIFKI